MTRLVLSGEDWQVKDYYGEDWRWRQSDISVRYDAGVWYAAAVPGTVANDLLQAGEIPNPYFERNSRLLEWIPARTWVYRKSFTVDESLRGQRAQLRFEGIDYEAQVFLNGVDLGQHVGMYTPVIFDVRDALNYEGENVLAVIVEAAPHEEPQVGRTSKVRTHKSRMTYWWDFCPRMVHIGIWDEVFLDFTGNVRIDDIFVRTQLSDDFQQANVSVSTTVDIASGQFLSLETTLRYHGEVVAHKSTEHRFDAGKATVDSVLPIEKPRLWYPNGYGDQPLYDAEVRLLGEDGTELNSYVTRFGIRKIEFIPNDTEDATARPYTLVVNGQRMYIKGWNWVPMDVMYGVPRPDKLQRLLTLAQRAHVNMLRIWGGGLIEKEAFYDLCDELGILVWQEFIQSSSGIDNVPPTDSDFIDFMVREAEQIIPRKRNHPSLAIWCGGNELTGQGEVPLDDRHPMLGALKNVVARLDPDRYWLPTSPTGRVFGYFKDNIEKDPTALHDVHGPWEYQGVTEHYALYNQGSSLLHSEFGVEGLTNRKSLNATIALENQLPVTLKRPIWQHLGAWWVKEPMWRDTFGDINDIDTLIKATQLMQADGLRYALEADRRRKYQNSGTLPWQFNEPFPMAACTSSVDYYQQAKPAYYAVARAYEPVHVSARYETVAWAGHDTFSADIWANNSLAQSIEDANLHVQVIDVSGSVYLEETTNISLASDSATQVTRVELPLSKISSDVFFLDLKLVSSEPQILSHNRYVFTQSANLAPLLNVPQAHLSVDLHNEGDNQTVTITNTGDVAALFIWLEDAHPIGRPDYAYFEDNHFCLLPQETRILTVTWEATPLTERILKISGWNAESGHGWARYEHNE